MNWIAEIRGGFPRADASRGFHLRVGYVGFVRQLLPPRYQCDLLYSFRTRFAISSASLFRRSVLLPLPEPPNTARWRRRASGTITIGLPSRSILLEQLFELLIEVLTGVDEVHEDKTVRMIKLVNNAVLGLAFGEVI
jgi:hypothetical protein